MFKGLTTEILNFFCEVEFNILLKYANSDILGWIIETIALSLIKKISSFKIEEKYELNESSFDFTHFLQGKNDLS